jgi:hypothetical protein
VHWPTTGLGITLPVQLPLLSLPTSLSTKYFWTFRCLLLSGPSDVLLLPSIQMSSGCWWFVLAHLYCEVHEDTLLAFFVESVCGICFCYLVAQFLMWRFSKFKKPYCCQVLVTHTCNPNYLEGWDWEDHGSRLGWDHLQNNKTKMDWRCSSSGIVPTSKCEILSSNSSLTKKTPKSSNNQKQCYCFSQVL